jgi:predicted DsbA family dithiol-disulfide isomerase
MHHALFDAYWLEGLDVSNLDVLRGIGARVGLDVDAMEAAIRANTYGDYLDARRAEALELMISGIPAHVINDRYLVMGAQPYEVFESVLGKVGTIRRNTAGHGT